MGSAQEPGLWFTQNAGTAYFISTHASFFPLNHFMLQEPGDCLHSKFTLNIADANFSQCVWKLPSLKKEWPIAVMCSFNFTSLATYLTFGKFDLWNYRLIRHLKYTAIWS